MLAACSNGHRQLVPFRLLGTHDGDTTPLYGRPFKCRAYGSRDVTLFYIESQAESMRYAQRCSVLRYRTGRRRTTRPGIRTPICRSRSGSHVAALYLGKYLRVNRCAYADVEADQDTVNVTGDYNDDASSIVGRYRIADFGAECLRSLRAGGRRGE